MGRRAELQAGSRFAFIADKDIWVVTGIPDEYKAPELIFTHGYSIENDVYIDGQLEGLLIGTEKAEFEAELLMYLEWYALALSRHMIDDSEAIDVSPYRILDTDDFWIDALRLRIGEVYPTELLGSLRRDYKSSLRGKSLFGVLFR